MVLFIVAIIHLSLLLKKIFIRQKDSIAIIKSLAMKLGWNYSIGI